MEKQRINRLALILHVLIVVTTLWSLSGNFSGEADVLGSVGKQCFKYFTTDSNVMACIGSALYLFFLTKEKEPQWAKVFRFSGTVAVTITLLTVVLFLGPTAAAAGGVKAFMRFYEGRVFVMHLSTPLLSILAFLLPERGKMLSRGEALWGIAPVVLYSLVYLVMVVFLQRWKDWYGFTFGGHYALAPLVMLVMYAFAAAVSLLEWKLKSKLNAKNGYLLRRKKL